MSAREAVGSLGPLLERLEHLAVYKIRPLKEFYTATFESPIALGWVIDPHLLKEKEDSFAFPPEELVDTGARDKVGRGYVAYLAQGPTKAELDSLKTWASWSPPKVSSLKPLLAIHYHLGPDESKRYYVGSSSGMVLKIFGAQRLLMVRDDPPLHISSKEAKQGKVDVHYKGKTTEDVATVIEDEEPVGYHRGRVFGGEEGVVVKEWM
jgi:hypothetical protein